eukprot:9429091-Pyramimonas_sp.AAC.1
MAAGPGWPRGPLEARRLPGRGRRGRRCTADTRARGIAARAMAAVAVEQGAPLPPNCKTVVCFVWRNGTAE